MMTIEKSEICQWDFTDHNRTMISCKIHKNEREVLKPTSRNATLAALMRAGKWAGPNIEIPAGEQSTGDPLPLAALPPPQPQELVASGGPPRGLVLQERQEHKEDLIEYQTPDGQEVSMSVQMFRQMICPQANDTQARYMMGWCAHNRIDPYANEAHFSIMKEREKDKDGNPTGVWLEKPSIMVSKDCWLRRMERHPQLAEYDSGLIVDLSTDRLKQAVVSGMGDDYLVPQVIKDRLLADALEGKLTDPKGMASRLTVRKRGQYIADGEQLEGAWVRITRKDRPLPKLFELNRKGWDKDNVFWKSMGPFMMWKTALKNGIRESFPELSGLIAMPEARDNEIDPAAAADAEFTHRCTTEQLRALHAIGSKVPAPVGPLRHEHLHAIASENYDGRGLAELTIFEMSQLIDLIEVASRGDKATLDALSQDLNISDAIEATHSMIKQGGETDGRPQDPDGPKDTGSTDGEELSVS